MNVVELMIGCHLAKIIDNNQIGNSGLSHTNVHNMLDDAVEQLLKDKRLDQYKACLCNNCLNDRK